MKSLLLYSLLCLPLALFAEGSKIKLSVDLGSSITLQLEDYARSVDVSKSGVIDITKGRTKKVLYLKGQKPGDVDVEIELQNGEVSNYLVTVSKSASSIISQISDIKGIKAKEKGGKIFVSGTIRDKGAKNELKQIKRRYPRLIVDQTKTSLANSNSIVETINRVLVQNDMANIRAHAYGKMIVLEGSAKDANQASLAVKIAKMIHGNIDVRLSEVSKGGPAIAIEVVFIETSKSNEKEIGISPKVNDQASLQAVQNGSAGYGIFNKTRSETRGDMTMNWNVGTLTGLLKLVQSTRDSRVLANPKLVARSGESASFFNGRTVFFTADSSSEGNVVKQINEKQIGIGLKITPILDATGQIDSKINVTVSDMAGVDADSNLPETTSSTLDTAITIRDGQTILLSGLTRKSHAKSIQRVPGLADIPVVGELFKSRDITKQENELMILVSMYRVDADNENASQAGQELFEKAGKDVNVSFFD